MCIVKESASCNTGNFCLNAINFSADKVVVICVSFSSGVDKIIFPFESITAECPE